MSDQPKLSSGAKLQELLGFDPTKRGTLSANLFSEVVKEIADERHKEAKARAKEHLVKAIQLREQMAKARKDFDAQDKKFEKELGRVLSQIQGILSGNDSPSPDDEECEKKECANDGEVVSA